MQAKLFAISLAFVVGLAVTDLTAASQADPSNTSEIDLSSPKAQMDAIAEKAIVETIRVVGQSGGFFPYAMVMDKEKKIRIIGIGSKPEEGTSKDEVAISLFWQLRKLLQDSPAFIAAAIVKPHTVKGEDGGSVPGIWVTVDHREHLPWVIFWPFVKQEDGTYRVGEQPAYLPAKEPLFLPGLSSSSGD